jgi:hypothetical protein
MIDIKAFPPALGPVVPLALAEVERRASLGLAPGSSVRARVVSMLKRNHSLITVLEVAGATGPRRFFLKTLRGNLALKRRQLEREFSLLEELALRFAPHPGMGVIQPVRAWPEHASMLTEEFSGVTLERFLARARRVPLPRATERAAALCRSVGSWLALFQGFTKPPESTLFDPQDLVRYCERRLGILADAAAREPAFRTPADLGPRVRSLAATVELSECLQVGRQNDFRPDNILTDGERVAVLDFTGFTYGPPLYDFMKFHMKLEDLAHGLMLRPAAVAGWMQAFRDGYGAPVDLRSPLARLLRVANTLDKMSELTLGMSGDGSKRTRRRRAAHRARLDDLEAALAGAPAR